MPERPTGENPGGGGEIRVSYLYPALNHIKYRHTYRNNAIPRYRHAKLALELELTVAKEDVCGPNIPIHVHSMVQEFYRRHELSNALGIECIRQLMSAAEFPNQCMIIHRDSKPAKNLSPQR